MAAEVLAGFPRNGTFGIARADVVAGGALQDFERQELAAVGQGQLAEGRPKEACWDMDGLLGKAGPCPSRDGSSRTRLKKSISVLGTRVRAMDAMRTGGLRGENPAAA